MKTDRPIYGADDEIWKRAPKLEPDIRLTAGDRIAVFIVFVAAFFATLVVCIAISLLGGGLGEVIQGPADRGTGGVIVFAIVLLLLTPPALIVVPYLAVAHHVRSIKSSKARRRKYLPSTIVLEPKEPSS